MKNRRILLIGPLPEPTTGVSLANKVVCGILKEHPDYSITVVNTSFAKFDDSLGSFSLLKLWVNLKFNLQCYKVFRSDIVYFTPGQTFFGVVKYALFIVLSTLSRKQIITHIHGNYLGTAYRSMKGIKKTLVKGLLSKCHKGIVLSDSLKPNLTPFIDEIRIYSLHNFAEDYLTENDKPASREIRIIYLSNLMEEKGIYTLLEALSLLEERGVAYKAQIAGAVTPENKIRVEKHISTLKHTTYVGIVKGEEKKRMLHWGSVFVLPTFYKMEGQPISILEALATQNVIITTAHAGIPDVITDGVHGYFVKKEDATDIADTIEKLTKQPETFKKMCSDNKAYFETHFTKSIFASKLIDIIKA